MTLTRKIIIKQLKEFQQEYITIKQQLIDLLNIKHLNENSEINEIIHIKIYDVNHIINGFQKNIDQMNDDYIYNINESNILENLNEDFMLNLQQLVDCIKIQMNNIYNNI